MKILCTCPGKFGDILWALPTVRSLAEAAGQPVSLMTSPGYASILPLLQAQPYIADAGICPTWAVRDTAPMTPWNPFDGEPPALPQGYTIEEFDSVIHLGYRRWPRRALPYEIEAQTREEYGIAFPPIDLQTPWITPPAYHLPPQSIAIGFTDEWFELKFGLYWSMRNRFCTRRAIAVDLVDLSASPRWDSERGIPGTSWESAAAWLAASQVFLGCTSALHVLARAVGKPVVLMEPAEARWQDIFYPYGKEAGGVELVCGLDGRPTFDARHVGDALEKWIQPSELAVGEAEAKKRAAGEVDRWGVPPPPPPEATESVRLRLAEEETDVRLS